MTSISSSTICGIRSLRSTCSSSPNGVVSMMNRQQARQADTRASSSAARIPPAGAMYRNWAVPGIRRYRAASPAAGRPSSTSNAGRLRP
ncbi:hypothetical protein D3C75_918880 [compost metagenome]